MFDWCLFIHCDETFQFNKLGYRNNKSFRESHACSRANEENSTNHGDNCFGFWSISFNSYHNGVQCGLNQNNSCKKYVFYTKIL